jgi:catechol 2,3-dioxygenase-like lactoylglutathione lyase family enzyme
MEHVIADLLNQFERGLLTRRQLIKSLALGSAAASVRAGAAAAAETGFSTVAVNHISYQVADYGKTRDFYVDLLGMKASDDNGRQVNLSFGADGAILLARNARQAGTAPKVDHIGYTIAHWNKDAVKAELERRTLEPRPDTDLSFHVKDPDGFDVQICGKG